MGASERLFSMVLGGALITYGLSRHSWLDAGLSVLGGGALIHRGYTGHCQVYAALGHHQDDAHSEPRELIEAPHARASLTIGKPAAELSSAWRDIDNQALVMAHFAELSSGEQGQTRWSVQGPLGTHLTWATTVHESSADRLAWRSVEGGSLASEGWVQFRAAPGDRGTEVTLYLGFDPPGGVVGNAVARLLGAPAKVLVTAALRRFKSLVETGEIATLEHNPSARASAPLLDSFRIAPQPT